MDPDLRITLRRDGVVRAVRWMPHLVTSGPLATMLDARDRARVTIADVEFERDDDEEDVEEAIVAFRAGGDAAARDVLTEWAQLIGVTRIWFDDEVRDVAPLRPSRMQTRCPACHNRLVDGSEGFWSFVRTNGHHPCACPICGGDLPQWRPVRRRVPRRRLELVEQTADLRMSDAGGGRRP